MSDIKAVARQLEQLAQEIDEREAAMAAAMELLSVDGAVMAAYRDGRRDERERITDLIDNQLNQLDKVGIQPLALKALRRQVMES